MFYKFEIYIIVLIWKQVYYDSLKLSFFSGHDINNKRIKKKVSSLTMWQMNRTQAFN